MFRNKQTARKSYNSGGRVGPQTLAGKRVEDEHQDEDQDEDEELGDTGEDEEGEDEVQTTLPAQAKHACFPQNHFCRIQPTK